MEVKFFENEKTIILELLNYSNTKIFSLIANELSRKFDVKWKEKIDGFDERYWDFEANGMTLTLHLQHYLGIMIFAAKTNPKILEATQFLHEIGEHFQKWNPPVEEI